MCVCVCARALVCERVHDCQCVRAHLCVEREREADMQEMMENEKKPQTILFNIVNS